METKTFYKARRYRLYPTPEQEERLLQWQWRLRDLWNDAARQIGHARRWERFAGRKWEATEDKKGSIQYPTDPQRGLFRRVYPSMPQRGHIWKTFKILKDMGEEDFIKLPSAIVGGMGRDFEESLKRSWDRLKKGTAPGWPRWKSLNDPLPSMEFPVWVVANRKPFMSVRFGRDSVQFPKAQKAEGIGRIKYQRHQKLIGRPKTARIICENRQWFVIVSCECELKDRITPPNEIGLDMGIYQHVTDSNGEVHEFVKSETRDRLMNRISEANRILARAKPGSKSRQEKKNDLEDLHTRMRRFRRGQQHNIASKIVSSNGHVVMEDLSMTNMTHSASGTVENPGTNVAAKSGLNRELLNVAPYQFRMLIEDKLKRVGGQLTLVDPRYTSQTCFSCGHRCADSRISQSEFVCVKCGHTDHADINAAKNILARGSGSVSGPREESET